jgi:hypothetical protein
MLASGNAETSGKNGGRTFYACYPHPNFPTLSITGQSCALQCKHCNAHYLQGMRHCPTPETLYRTCVDLASNGAQGVLVSGGFNNEGYVPFDPFLDKIEKVKQETGLFINIHPGLVPRRLARDLGRAGVDQADFDMIGDDETVRFVTGLDRTVEDYKKTLHSLAESLPHVAPHICIGLYGGKIKGEFKAIQLASEVNISVLVFLVVTPTPNTVFEKIHAPPLQSVVEVMERAKRSFQNTELALGCMRPRAEREELELAALRAGVNRIEIPCTETIKTAEKMGFHVQKLKGCCSIPSSLTGEFLG